MKCSSMFLQVTAAAVLCFAAGTASATPSTLTIDSTGYGEFHNNQVATTFTDFFTFTMPSSATEGLGGAHVTGNSDMVSLSFIGLFQGAKGIGTLVASASSAGAKTLDITSFLLSAAGLNPYYLEVRGTASGSTNPGYAGSISVSPVPEPKTYAMLLAGLGLLAFTARSRRTSFF